MKDNFKLFDLLNGTQLLATRDYNDDENPCVTFSYFVDGAKVEMSFGFGTEESRDKVFDPLDQDKAERIYNSISKSLF